MKSLKGHRILLLVVEEKTEVKVQMGGMIYV